MPKITTQQGAVVISGLTVAIHTEACPNADLDVCAIGRSIAAFQTNAANATQSLAALAHSSTEARETSIGDLSTSVAAAQTTAMGEVAVLLSRMDAAINATKCQQNPIDACGFTKACDGGPVE